MPSPTRIHVFPTAAGVMQLAARTLRDACSAREGGTVTIALSGGSTPALLYRRLAEDFLGEIPWSGLEIFFGDERAVPPDADDSNFRLALHHLLSKVPVAPERVHRMAAEEPDLERAARRYEDEIRRIVRPGPLGDPAFDLIWLGVGEDGHTASLFPATAALGNTEDLVTANDVPQLHTRRMTFTFPLLNSARRVQFLVLGAKKAHIVREILGPADGGAPLVQLPASRVRPLYGTLEWLLDREAAAELSDPGLIA